MLNLLNSIIDFFHSGGTFITNLDKFITKVGRNCKVGWAVLQSRAPSSYYRVQKELVRNVAGNLLQSKDNSYYKVGTGITKWGHYCKIGQYRGGVNFNCIFTKGFCIRAESSMELGNRNDIQSVKSARSCFPSEFKARVLFPL